jgi:hypothetical protein
MAARPPAVMAADRKVALSQASPGAVFSRRDPSRHGAVLHEHWSCHDELKTWTSCTRWASEVEWVRMAISTARLCATGEEAVDADDAAVTEGTAPSPPRPTRSLESAEAAQGAGWGATTRTATTMSSSHLAAAVRTQPAPPKHRPPSTKQRVHRPPRPTPTPPTEVTEDGAGGAVAAEREETDARSWRRMRGPQTPLTAWDAPAREWLRGKPSGKRVRGTRRACVVALATGRKE